MKRIVSKIMSIWLSFLLCISTNAQQIGVQQQIVTDGKTNTTVKVKGKTTDITTSTVQGKVAYNSFSTFNVAQGNTVDLVLPSGTLNLLNLVNSQAINIWGVLNSIQNGKIGGNVLFADPFGMVVGKSGSINVGALMLVTPTKTFMDSLFSGPGAPSAANTSLLLSGAVPISSDGMILVQGKINTISDAMLVGQSVTNSGKITSGAVFAGSQPDFSDVVNVNGLVVGNALSTQNGNIEIVAQGDFQNSGQVSTNGANGLNAGNISIQAGNDVMLNGGSLISASGVGQNSNAGSIKIMAGNNATFDQGAVIAASGGNVSGNGGAIEFSAKNTVTLNGGSFEGGALHGQAGSLLIDPATLDVIANTFTGGTDAVMSADVMLTVEPGVTINTQTLNGSTVVGNSGNISLTAPQMNIGNCTGSCAPTVLDASAPGFTAGNVTLAATSNVSKTWDPNNPDANFNIDQANASIILSPNAVIKGQDVSITATATNSKTVNLTETPGGGQAQAPDALCIVVGGAGSCGTNGSPVSITDNVLGMVGNQYSSGDSALTSGWAGGVVSKATSNIQVQGGAQIIATGKVAIDAEASSTANMTANGLYFTYAESDASATAQVQNGASISAAGDFDLTAHSTNNLTNTGQAVAGQPNLQNSTITQVGPAVAVTYSVATSDAVAGVETGATVSADNVNVTAKDDNSFQTQANPSTNLNTNLPFNQQFGAGIGIVVSDTSSTADAHLNGTINAAGSVTSDAESLTGTDPNTMNQASADAEANNDNITGNQNADDAIKYFGGKLTSNSSSNKGSDAQDNNPTVSLGAAVVVVSDTNTASSTVGPNAKVASGVGCVMASCASDNVSITANASDKFEVGATGSADQASASIGGAVAVTTFTNSATASVDSNANVNAAGTLNVTATAELPSDAATALEGIEQYIENFTVTVPASASDFESWVTNIRNEIAGGGGLSGLKTTALDPIVTEFDNLKNIYTDLTSGMTSSLSSVGQPGGSGVGVSGTVDLLTANNTATAFVDKAATVSAQSANVEATAAAESVNAAGTSAAVQNSLFSKVFGQENSDQAFGSFGGTYSGITYNNTANSYVASGASVTTTSADVNVTSTANNFMANKFSAGASSNGGDLALSGAISNVTINSTSQATIDNTAVINSAGNVNVDAENNKNGATTVNGMQGVADTTGVYQLGINTDSSGTVGAGVALSFLNINDTTQGFIGNNDAITGETTTGTAGTVTTGTHSSLEVSANSYERMITASASSVAQGQANGTTNSGGPCSSNCPTASAGEKNGANSTADSNPNASASSYQQGSGDGFGVSGDIAFNNVNDTTNGYISGGVTVNSGGTTVSATDKSLMVAADGGLVRESTFGLQGAFADNSINKTTEAYTSGVTLDTGFLSVNANSSDVVIAATAGGAYAQGNSSALPLAGSVNFDNITNTTTASVDGTSVRAQDGSSATGAVTVTADNRETIFSVAGSFACCSGDVGVGVSLDLGNVDNTVDAGIDSGSNIQSSGSVAVTASDDENHLSVSADLAVGGSNDIAASIGVQTVTKDVEAAINGTVNATGPITVAANDDQGGSSLGLPTGLIAIDGAVPVSGGSGDTGLGAASNTSITDKTVKATIGDGANVTSSLGDVDVTATATDNLDLFGGGGAYGADVGFMGSAVVNTITNTVAAAIGTDTGVSGASVSGQNVNVQSSDALNIIDGAGGIAGSKEVAVGAGGDVECIGTGTGLCAVGGNNNPLTVTASIAPNATVAAIGSTGIGNGNVNVTATETPTITSVAADVGFGSGDATVIGSGTVLGFNTNTSASSDGNVTANGTLNVNADRVDNITTIAGSAAVAAGAPAGVGISVSFVDKTDNVYASVGGGTDNVGGLQVSATGNDTLNPVVIGAGISTSAVGVAVSGIVNILNETTDSYVGEATLNPNSAIPTIPVADIGASGPTVNAGTNGVSITSTSNTQFPFNTAALVAVGDDVGVGVAADVNTITKNTYAEIYPGANLNATGSVNMSANAEETATSLGAAAAGGAYAGVAVSTSVYVVNDTTNASIDGGATVAANGGVGVSSIDTTDMDLVDGSIAGGEAGVGAALALADVTKDTNAIVDGTVTAKGQGAPINADNGTFSVSYAPFLSGFGKNVGTGGNLSNSNLPSTGTAPTPNFLQDKMLTGERRATPNTSPVNGLAVTATSVNDFNTVAAGGAGGYVGVVANGSILLLNNFTKAEIGSGAKIQNGTDSVLVDAATDFGHIGGAFGAAGGFVAAVPSFDISIIGNTTTADIASANVNASGNVTVNANANENLMSLVVGLGGGAVGAAGSLSFDKVTETTTADISGTSTVNAGGNLSVNSTDSTDTDVMVGALGGGYFAGAGASVAVVLVNKDTQAYLGDGVNQANTMVGGATSVNATSSEQLSQATVAGGGAVFGATAGAVSFESDNSTTSANVGAGTDTAGAGLTVSATNTANAYTFDGTATAALGSISGSVDVGSIQNPTTAEIDSANVTTTSGNVDVMASENRTINSTAVSFGTGGVPVEASVIDWGVSAGVNRTGAGLTSGNPLNGSSYNSSSGTVYDGADTQTGSAVSGTSGNSAPGCAPSCGRVSGASGVLGTLGSGAAEQQAQTAHNDLGADTGGSPVKSAVTAAPASQGTTAEIFGGSVHSAGGVTVQSTDTTTLGLTAGGASLGAIGVGASVDIASVNTSSTAEILGGSQVSADGNVVIDAGRTENLSGQALGGNGGLVFGGGAAVTVVTDNGTTDAEMGATVNQSSGLQITASTLRDDSATSGQVSAGGAAAGYSYASVNEGGNTTAQIDGGSMTLPAVQSVQLSADDNSAAFANSTGITAGIVSVGGAEADTMIDPSVDAHIAGGAVINTTTPTQNNPGIGGVQVVASTEEDANSNVNGVNAGGLSIGTGSNANATTQPTVDAYIDGTVNAGGSVTVAARENFDSNNDPLYTCPQGVTNGCANVQAQASTSAGSLLANVNTGSNAQASSLPTVSGYLGTGADVNSGGTVSIYSESGSSVSSNASGTSISAINLPGNTNASSTITNSNSAYVTGATVSANNFFMSAQSSDNARGANVTGSALGLGSGDSTSASSLVTGTTEAHVTGNSTINSNNDATIEALVAEQGNASASNRSAGVITVNNVSATVGNPSQNGPVDTPKVITDNGTNINSVTATLDADITQALFSATTDSHTLAAGSNSTATSTVNVNGSPLVQVDGNIDSNQKLSLIATVNNDPNMVSTNAFSHAEIDLGVTGNLTAASNNYTTLSPQVVVDGTSTLTTDNLYIEATAPLLPSNGNPFYANNADAVANTVVETVTETVQEVVDDTVGWIPFVGPLIEQATEWVTKTVQETLASNVSNPTTGAFVTNQGITLNNPTIIQPGGTNPTLIIGPNGNVVTQQNVSFTRSEDDIIVNPVINNITTSITLNTPAGFTAGNATVHNNSAFQSVTIVNSSTEDLVLNSIDPMANNGAQPQVNITADPTRNNVMFNFVTDNTSSQVTVTNNSTTADTDIYLNGGILDPGGNVTMSALLGSILPMTPSNQTEATAVTLTANHGSIGLSTDPLNITLVPVEQTSQTTAAPGTLNVLAGQNLYANLTPLEFFQPGDSVPASVPVNLQSIEAGGAIDLNLNPATAVVPQPTTITIPGFTLLGTVFPPITITTYANTNNTVNGVYNVAHDITAGGNILVNAPALTTLNLQPGSSMTSGFANIGVNIAANGTVTGSPIPVNYTNTVDSNNVVMQSLQQQGGNVTIAGAGALAGTGTINVLNGYSNLNITNNSNANLVMNNLSFDNPVTGTVSVFGATQSLNGGNYAGTGIALTETNNPTSTISITQNGASGDLQLAGVIRNQSGTTTLTAANTNIVNTGGSSELVESNYINFNASKGQIGSSATPINVQVDGGYVNATAHNDIALDQVSGNLNLNNINSSNGNVYLTAAGSILDASGAVDGGNLVLDAITGSIGASTTPLNVVATGTLTGQAQTGAYITETTGPMNVNNVTSNTGNVVLSTLAGNINLGSNSVDAPNGTATLNSSANINDSTSATAISANNVVLNSANGNIGSAANPIEENSSLNAAGTVSGTDSNGSMWVNETVGAMNIGTLQSTNGNVNLTTTLGSVNGGTTTANNGNVNIAANGNVNVGTIIATPGAAAGSGTVNVSAVGSILNGNTAPTNVNITAKNMNLTASSTIGTSVTALTVDTTTAGGAMNATAPGDIYVTQPSGAFYVGNVNSTATGNIGLTSTAGDLDLGTVTSTGGNVTLTSGGNTNLGLVNALAGNTTINAGGSILNGSGPSATINTQGITLNAINGSIGTQATPLRIHSNAGAALVTPAVVQALAKLGIYLNETFGALYVSSITSSTSDIYIISDGSIFNGNPNGAAVNLTGNNINLTSNNGGIGLANRRLVVNNGNGVNTVSAAATGTPTGHSLDMYANGSSNGNIYVEERSGDLISSNTIKSKTGNVDLLVTNGSAWINQINVSPFGNPATTNLGATQNKTVTILVQGNVLNTNTISSPDSLTMTVNPGTTWTTTPGTDTIRVGQADVFSTITARADNINMPQVYALNQGNLTNDISRQTEGLHFFVSGWGNPGGYNYLANLASNVNINVSPCPVGCSTIPAVVFNNLTTNYATINSGADWFEIVNGIIGTQGTFTTPYQTTTVTYKFPQQQSATRYTPFYIFNFGSYQETDANPPYWVMKDKTLKGYTLTQPLNTIFNDLIKYYALP